MLTLVPSVNMRVSTFPHRPARFLNEKFKPRMDFLKYYTTIWTPWIKQVYLNATKPFLLGPDSDYSHCGDPHMLASQEGLVQKLAQMSDENSALASRLNSLVKIWMQKSVVEREELLLEIIQGAHEMYERADSPMICVEVPELSLALAAGNGSSIFPFLSSALSYRLDGIEVPVIHPNGQWDRLWYVGKYTPATPFSLYKRVFIHTALCCRALHLLTFVRFWMASLSGVPIVEERFAMRAPTVPLNEATAPCMFATDDKGALDSRLASQKVVSGVVCCESCDKPPVALPDAKFLCCSKCKGVGRMVMYCSAAHQKDHWPIHKRFCGKDPGAGQ